MNNEQKNKINNECTVRVIQESRERFEKNLAEQKLAGPILLEYRALVRELIVRNIAVFEQIVDRDRLDLFMRNRYPAEKIMKEFVENLGM